MLNRKEFVINVLNESYKDESDDRKKTAEKLKGEEDVLNYESSDRRDDFTEALKKQLNSK